MSGGLARLVPNLLALALSGRASPRAFAAAFKLCGRRLERRWPFMPKASGKELNLGFDDVLEFQLARATEFVALVIGAYDGVANDPASKFIRSHVRKAVFVEPQPGPFQRLRASMQDCHGVDLVNAAIDEESSTREFFTVPSGIAELPAWTEQLGSFDRDHLLKHEERAPGLSQHIVTLIVPTLSFADLLDQFAITRLDLLQIDAEGMDAKLLGWFPFHRLKPAIVYYENAHMSRGDREAVRARLMTMGYTFCEQPDSLDDIALLF